MPSRILQGFFFLLLQKQKNQFTDFHNKRKSYFAACLAKMYALYYSGKKTKKTTINSQRVIMLTQVLFMLTSVINMR